MLQQEEEKYKRLIEHLESEAKNLNESNVKVQVIAYDNFFFTSEINYIKILDEIKEQIWQKIESDRMGKHYLIGHSYGSILARHLVCDINRGEATPIQGIILLANSNRGFEFENLGRITSLARLFPSIIDLLGLDSVLKRLHIGNRWLEVRRGTPLTRDLRLKWLRTYEHNLGNRVPNVQMNGDKDELIEDDDSRMPYQFSWSKQPPISILGFKHGTFALKSKQPAVEFKEKLREAFTYIGIGGTIQNDAKSIDWPSDWPYNTQPTKRHVVFLVHGIRDHADWHESMEYQLRQTIYARSKDKTGTDDESIEVISVRYGYFNAFQFLFPSQRRRCVRSFVDYYYQVLAKYPDVDQQNIHILAHSNGTFVVGHALRIYNEIKVGKILLAASVLPSDFNWSEINDRSQYFILDSFCCDSDVPVGWLCSALSFFKVLTFLIGGGLGVGGYRGFSCLSNYKASFIEKKASFIEKSVGTNYFMIGGHGSPIHIQYHESIAHYLLSQNEHASLEKLGKAVRHENEDLKTFQDTHQSLNMRLHSGISFFLQYLGVPLLAFIFYRLMLCLSSVLHVPFSGVAAGMGLGVLLVVILSKI
jgi:pimeloyl-ACP methyl ester carboxylesterase